MMEGDISELNLSPEQVIELTAAEVLKSMEKIWLNEKFAPEILAHKVDVVECLHTQIQEMEKNMEQLERTDLRKCAYEMELNRIKFLTSSYLRTRVFKIEAYAKSIMEEDAIRQQNGDEPYLTEAETAFAENYQRITERYCSSFLNLMPGLISDESKENPIRPNHNSFVFCKAERDLNGVVVVNEDVVDIREGSKMIIPYSSIDSLLKNGHVALM